MTFEEIRKLHQHKIPARKEAEHILAKSNTKGAELGSVIFSEVVKQIRGETKGASDDFRRLYYTKKNRLYDRQEQILKNWEAFTNYVARTHRTIYYQQIIAFLGIAKLTDTIRLLLETDIKTLVEVLPRHWADPISDAIQFCLGWNTFVDISFDFFGIQERIKKELKTAGLSSLLGVLQTPNIKEALNDTELWEQLEKKAGEKASITKEAIAQVKEIADIKPPTQERVKDFSERWYKATVEGTANYYFYEYNETMLLMFYR